MNFLIGILKVHERLQGVEKSGAEAGDARVMAGVGVGVGGEVGPTMQVGQDRGKGKGKRKEKRKESVPASESVDHNAAQNRLSFVFQVPLASQTTTGDDDDADDADQVNTALADAEAERKERNASIRNEFKGLKRKYQELTQPILGSSSISRHATTTTTTPAVPYATVTATDTVIEPSRKKHKQMPLHTLTPHPSTANKDSSKSNIDLKVLVPSSLSPSSLNPAHRVYAYMHSLPCSLLHPPTFERHRSVAWNLLKTSFSGRAVYETIEKEGFVMSVRVSTRGEERGGRKKGFEYFDERRWVKWLRETEGIGGMEVEGEAEVWFERREGNGKAEDAEGVEEMEAEWELDGEEDEMQDAHSQERGFELEV